MQQCKYQGRTPAEAIALRQSEQVQASRPARLPHVNPRYPRCPRGSFSGGPVSSSRGLHTGMWVGGAAAQRAGAISIALNVSVNLTACFSEPLAISRPALSRNLTSVSTIRVTGTSPSALCHTALNS